jgi:hypothetical protein
MQVEVQRKSDEGLSRSVWVFYAQTWHGCGPLSVRLERFTNETRKSRRHGWQVASQWPHVRGYNAKPPCDKPTLDESIRLEVLSAIAARVEFVEIAR